jgi:DNA-binding response OmpR family regulator
MLEERRILIVEDDEDYGFILKKKLEKAGFQVDWERNGEKGLEAVRKNLPDLVLLDVMMNGMSGFDVCRAIKEDPKLEELSVYFLTAVDDHMAVSAYSLHGGKSCTADDFIPKGEVTIDEAILKVEQFFNQS